ncbi:GrpB family protein [Rhizobium sp. R635]|uniref:GrpB family protein n=1 Tax=Rhizobium sp. R635 TaxID=1764275 RepID=UPI002477E0F8|nr:GrpB family protein [Rhizobium sp. R635]
MRIEIELPRQSWAEDFAALKRAIMRAAPAGAYLHHIGSTAISGLPAKDIIDLQLSAGRSRQVTEATSFYFTQCCKVSPKPECSAPRSSPNWR